jgi:predicted 3-demethylubiquinone-9 3-methyltransferase (glyoxalase superfamily)
MYVGEQEIFERITPTLMFVGDACGRAEEAVSLYASVFDNSTIGPVNRYGPGEEPEAVGTVRHVVFSLEGHHFAAMDSAQAHNFGFNEAISFLVECRTQEEIDRYFGALSAVPESEQCGWLKDKYGVSWQVAPAQMQEYLYNSTPEQMERVTGAFLQMGKIDLAELEKAYQGS